MSQFVKLYLAGKFQEKDSIRAIATALPATHAITAPWYDFEQADAYVRSSEQSLQVGEKEMMGVVEAKYYVAIINDKQYPYKGTLTEMGIALGWNQAHGFPIKDRVFLITPKEYAHTNLCVALHVPHTFLATRVPIMNGESIQDNIAVIVNFISSLI